MTPEQFAARMRKIAEMCDIEESHELADKLMTEVLRQHGYAEGVEIYIAMPKWFA